MKEPTKRSRRPAPVVTGEVERPKPAAAPNPDVSAISPTPFRVKDCALIRISTGLRAQNLRELLSCLRQAPAASIYHHFWGRLLEPTFDEPEYGNDFAAWGARALHDRALAERVGTIDPGEFESLEELRLAVIDAVETRLDESEMVPWARADQQFYFVWSQLVVFDTHRVLKHPDRLREVLPTLSSGSIFYHFIDARHRPPLGEDDFSAWLASFGGRYERTRVALRAIDPSLASLVDLRRAISHLREADRVGGGR